MQSCSPGHPCFMVLVERNWKVIGVSLYFQDKNATCLFLAYYICNICIGFPVSIHITRCFQYTLLNRIFQEIVTLPFVINRIIEVRIAAIFGNVIYNLLILNFTIIDIMIKFISVFYQKNLNTKTNMMISLEK